MKHCEWMRSSGTPGQVAEDEGECRFGPLAAVRTSRSNTHGASNMPHLVGNRVDAIRQRMPVCAVLIVSVFVPSIREGWPRYFRGPAPYRYVRQSLCSGCRFVVLLKLGGRFSRNAEMLPSLPSERTRSLNSSFSTFIAVLICSRNSA